MHHWSGEKDVHEAIYEAWILPEFLNWQKQKAIQQMKIICNMNYFFRKWFPFLFKKPCQWQLQLTKSKKNEFNQMQSWKPSVMSISERVQQSSAMSISELSEFEITWQNYSSISSLHNTFSLLYKTTNKSHTKVMHLESTKEIYHNMSDIIFTPKKYILISKSTY